MRFRLPRAWPSPRHSRSQPGSACFSSCRSRSPRGSPASPPRSAPVLLSTWSTVWSRFGIFLVYLALIALWSEIRRVFEYHGAEHMVVSAYEHGDPLTVAGARAHSTRHPRCGTNFLLVVVAVSVLVFSFIPGPWGFLAKFFSRLALLPVVAGFAYEILRLGGRPRARWLALPGYWLQALTTRPPSDDQIEVALRALREVLDMEGGVRGVHQAG